MLGFSVNIRSDALLFRVRTSALPNVTDEKGEGRSSKITHELLNFCTSRLLRTSATSVVQCRCC